MIAVDLLNYITNNLSPYAPVLVDGLGEKDDSIAIIQSAEPPTTIQYLDGSMSGDYSFELYARAFFQRTAHSFIFSAYQHFADFNKNKLNIPLEDGVCFMAEALKPPYLLTRAADGSYLYAASFRLVYDR